ncbi:serine/threonine protein phosphatase [Marinilabiliaceae bacterium JC017]|nr:serine/threonine protein phosphatase [Marinilabiliaceae bacterium JC017]
MKPRLLAIGDIHGCFKPFRIMVEEEIRLSKTDKLILLGDYIDRGQQSKEVVDYIMRLMGDGYDIVALRGNHEDMFLKGLVEDYYLFNWLMNGGYETMDSFNITHPDQMPADYLRFFRNLKLYYPYQNFLFVHAGFNDEAADPFKDEYHMVWRRLYYYTHPLLKDKTIVHGHRAEGLEYLRMCIDSNARVIDVDTGCVYTDIPELGHLSAVDLTNRKIYSVRNEEVG